MNSPYLIIYSHGSAELLAVSVTREGGLSIDHPGPFRNPHKRPALPPRPGLRAAPLPRLSGGAGAGLGGATGTTANRNAAGSPMNQ